MSRRISTILGIVLVASFVLAACGAPAAPAPAAPVATEAPACSRSYRSPGGARSN